MGNTLIDVCKYSEGRKNFTSVHRFIWPFYIKRGFNPESFGWKKVTLNRNNREWYSTFQYLSNNANKIFDNEICKIYRKDSDKQFYLIDKYSMVEVNNSIDAICKKFDISPNQKNYHFYKHGKNGCDSSHKLKLNEKLYIFDDNCIQWLIQDEDPKNLSVAGIEESDKEKGQSEQQRPLNRDVLKVVYRAYCQYDINGPVIIKKKKMKKGNNDTLKSEEEKVSYCICEINERSSREIEIDIDNSLGWELYDGNQILINPVIVKFDVANIKKNGNLVVNVYNSFRLPMCDYEMHIYNGQLGFLFINCINLKFDDYMETEKMKMINDYGRRVEIPYIPTSGSGITADRIGIVSLNGRDKSFSNEEKHVRDFRAYIDAYNKDNKKAIDNFYKPAKFLSEVVFDLNNKSGADCYSKYLDTDKNTEERMFAMTLVNIPSLCTQIKKIGSKEQDEAIKNLYPVIFNDHDDASCQNAEMRNELFKEAGNYRWTGWGTLHAITQYSFTCITSIQQAFDSVALPFINIYTYLCSIVLAQRYILLDYADKYTDIIIHGDKIGSLIKDYAIFKNELLLTELSTQEQGIEIYRKMRKQMLVDNELEELESQMTYLNDSVAYQFNTKMNFLSFYGIILTIIIYFKDSITSLLDDYLANPFIIEVIASFTGFFRFESNFNMYLLLIAIFFIFVAVFYYLIMLITKMIFRCTPKFFKFISYNIFNILSFIVSLLITILLFWIILLC